MSERSITSTLTIKAKLGEDLRRMTIANPADNLSLSHLKSSLSSLFALPPTQSLKLRYLDEDSDLITISADVELREAFLASKGNVLRLELEVIPFEAASSSSSPSPSPSSSSSFVEVASSPLPQTVESTVFVSASDAVPESVEQSSPVNLEEGASHANPVENLQTEALPSTSQREDLPPYDETTRTTPPPEKPTPRNNAVEVDYLLNEFHFHRILLQTAIEATYHNSKPKVNEVLQKMELQSAALLEAIERTLGEWKEDIRSSNAPQEFARHVSETLQEVGSFTTPLIAQIRISLSNLLQKVFRNNPNATNSDILKELETYDPSNLTSEEPAAAAAIVTDNVPKEVEESCDLENPAPVTEDMPTLLTKIATESDPTITSQAGEVKVPSELSEDFVYLDGYQQNQDIGADKERRVQEVSETVWADEFEFQAQLNDIVAMGFADSDALRATLVANRGDIAATLDTLL